MSTFSAPDDRSLLHNGGERAQLESWLTFYRESLLIKCDGLNEEQLKMRPIATSELSLLGLLRHVTKVERNWFEIVFPDGQVPDYYSSQDDSNGDIRNLDELSVDAVLANYRNTIEAAERCARDHDLNEFAKKNLGERVVDLRWIYLHMIEEYARHCGHADIIRELIDGVTGY